MKLMTLKFKSDSIIKSRAMKNIVKETSPHYE